MAPKRLWRSASLAVVACGVLAIVGSYSGTSPTWDEPTHIAAGLEWFQKGTYTLQTENPPLSRLPVAVGPHLDGARLRLEPGNWSRPRYSRAGTSSSMARAVS